MKKNILAENMLRFGIKNLSETEINKLKSLSEQKKLNIKISKGRWVDWGVNIGKSGTEIIDPVTWQQSITIPEDEWDTYIQTNQRDMLKKMSDTSKQHWTELIADPENKGYAVAALERFIQTNPSYKWQFVFCDSEEGIRQEIQKFKRIKGTTDAIQDGTNGINMPLEFPINGPSSTFFDDNLYAPTKAFETRLNEEVISPLVNIAADMKFNSNPNEPKFFLRAIDIQTSCSRFRNSKDAKDMTFAQLSKARNDAALQFIINKLKSIGVLVDGDTEISQNIDGKNGDGSSGPNPPAPVVFTKTGKETDIIKDESQREDYGKPLTNKAGYDKFKYCIAGLEIVANTNWKKDPQPAGEPDPDKQPEYEIIKIDIPTKNYGISFYSKPRFFGISFNLPKIKMWMSARSKKLFNPNSKAAKKQWGKHNCAKWSKR